jgi:hypothetical protein
LLICEQQFPPFAVETGITHNTDPTVIRRGSINSHTWQQTWRLEILEVCDHMHDVLTAEISIAELQYIDERSCLAA